MKDTGESQPQPIPALPIVPETNAPTLDAKNFDPKFLEVVEIVLRENAELLRRLAN